MKLSVIGHNNVGRAVVKLANSYGHDVVAFSDSESTVLCDEGIDPENLIEKEKNGEILGDGDPNLALSTDYDVLIESTTTDIDRAKLAFSHTKQALERDRHVVLSNKSPVALNYQEVRNIEKESKGSVRFSSTIGGALPAITTLKDIGRSHIKSITGALDGTANFILSRMAAEGLGYDHVLAEAQDLGIANSDPTFRSEGTDSAMKALILANLLWESEDHTLSDIDLCGIDSLTGSQLDLAKEDGKTVRLITELAKGDIKVGPRLVREHSSLAPSGSLISIEFETVHAGPISLASHGTGGIETATAIFSDIKSL